MRKPEFKTCCFCLPLRKGIIMLAIINIIASLCVETCLVWRTEVKKPIANVDVRSMFDVITSSLLFSVFGMGIILNLLLVVAGYQRDIPMLRLYNYYAVGTTLAALIPTSLMISRMMFTDVWPVLFTLVVQLYVIVLVRSEVVKLEQKLFDPEMGCRESNNNRVDVPDTVSLII